ncbi:hypothetical protein N0V95_001210 [Ascochyta clinopodiicola]|nr:hypothetical protein N0V95_001210 [Ascochyta clinopodiicola]
MLDPTFHITTPRLHLSYLDPTNDAHMEYIVRLKNSPEMRAMEAKTPARFNQQVLTLSTARAAQAAGVERLERTGTGRYIISLRDGDIPFTQQQEREYIGTVSMQFQRFPEAVCPAIPDVGFALLAAYQGRGYAAEAATALMQYFSEVKGHVRFAGFTHPENAASQNLFRRLGFEDRGVRLVDGVVPTPSIHGPKFVSTYPSPPTILNRTERADLSTDLRPLRGRRHWGFGSTWLGCDDGGEDCDEDGGELHCDRAIDE